MAQTRNWQGLMDMSARLLNARTGEGVEAWNGRITTEGFTDEQALGAWLTAQVMTGYAQSLFLVERFGYSAFFRASADELIQGQYADRPQLLLTFDARIDAAAGLSEAVPYSRYRLWP